MSSNFALEKVVFGNIPQALEIRYPCAATGRLRIGGACAPYVDLRAMVINPPPLG